MTLATTTNTSARTSVRTRSVFKALGVWLCSLALLAPTALLSPAFAAATVTTTTTVAASVNPVAIGKPTVLTASVTGSNPSGNVTFKKGTTTLGTGTLSGTGNTRSATYSATFTTVAANSITAVYAGDTVNKTSTSAALTLTSTKTDTTATVASSQASSTQGQSVTFTATISGYNPTGNVVFKDGTTTLASKALSGTGNTRSAVYANTTLAVGVHNITANYVGSTTNNISSSAAITQTILGKTATSTALASDTNPSNFGQNVTLTATVTGATPTGNVTFKNGTATLGTGTLTNGVASFATSALIAGARSLTAVYSGDAFNTTSTSAIVAQTVNKLASGVSLQSATNPVAVGAPTVLTATVTGLNPGGNVTFKNGTATLGTVALGGTGDTRTASYSATITTVGDKSLTAVYAGDADNLTATSAALTQTVGKANTTATVASSQANATPGQSVTFTTTVVGYNPTGNVVFKDGTTTLSTKALSGTGNTRTATFATSTLSTATHSITVVYAGDTNNATSTSSALNQFVGSGASTTTLTSNANPIALGASVTFTATLTGNAPTGTITFKDGATPLGTGTVTTGVATLSTNALTVGSHSITAVYAGDANNAASTSAVLYETISAALVGAPMTWQYGYDAMGRPTTTQDPYGKIAYTYYDSLGRAIQTQQAVGADQAIVSLEYNAADSLTKVTDPRSLQTTYSPTGLGTVTSQTSPDTGTAGATFDANGNVLTRTDARGKVTTYSYDNLNRPTTAHYLTGTDTTLEYDGGATPTPATAGEVTKITDESGTTSYGYDSAGRLTTKTQVSNGKTFVVTYAWGDAGSALDKLTSITYPSGTRVNYAYDQYGSVSGITVNVVNANGVGASGTASPLLSNVTLNAAGQTTGWTWASGKTQAIGYDQYGQVNSYKLGDSAGTGISAGTTRTINYDGAGRILGFTHTNNATPATSLNQSFAYDDLTRLISASMGSSSIQYSYDLTGNRTNKVISGTAYANTVSPTSNKLTQITDVGGTNTIQYDQMGNVTNDGVNTFTYSDRGRLATATTAGGTVIYRYNAMEQRAYKTGPAAIIPTGEAYYVYDEAGKLLGEYDANNNPIYETVYLGSSPVGVLKQTGTAAGNNIATTTYNVYSDHLATPRVITRASDEAIVWRWDAAEAYGATAPDQNPNNLGVFTFNQRLPGQVFDAETGLFQNWHREYNARIGRYMQSDPIGLAGGINTYAYVGGNPLSKTDPTGLRWACRTVGLVTICENTRDDPDYPSPPPYIPVPTLPDPTRTLCQILPWACVLPVIIDHCMNTADREKDCKDQFERDEAECLVARAGYGRRSQAICLSNAKEHYARCLRGN